MKTVRSPEDMIGQMVELSAGRPEIHTTMKGTVLGVDERGITISTLFAPGTTDTLLPRARFLPWHNVLELSSDTQVEEISLTS